MFLWAIFPSITLKSTRHYSQTLFKIYYSFKSILLYYNTTMSIKSLIIAMLAIPFAQQVSAFVVIGDRSPTSPKDLEGRSTLTYQCNVYSDSSCQNFIGSSVSVDQLGKCASVGGFGNSYLCFNVNDVEQVDFFYGSNCEDNTFITSQSINIGCQQSPETIRSVATFSCNDVDGSECWSAWLRRKKGKWWNRVYGRNWTLQSGTPRQFTLLCLVF